MRFVRCDSGWRLDAQLNRRVLLVLDWIRGGRRWDFYTFSEGAVLGVPWGSLFLRIVRLWR